MTRDISRDDIALYVMGAYDGDVAALEARIADDAATRAMLAEEAALELSMRDAGAAGTFCPNCDDLVADAAESGASARCASCGSAITPGGYRIERILVANAHGRMYVARDADGTKVALKELAFVQSPSTETVAAFEREAKFLRALEHPAIPRFRAAFEEGTGVHTRYYLAQDLVEGTALDARLDDHFFTEAEIVDIARQVLGVLVYLQSVSPMVIHRDIKPANLITRPDGSIAVVDFGAAHVQGTTAGSTSIGTFGYMPLEQLAGQVDATTDTYALGASLIHLLTRREPWRVFGPATFESINVSPALQRYLARCVAPAPEDRFANAAAALAGLDAPAVSLARRTPRVWRGPWKVAVGVLAAALTLGGAGVAGYVLRGEPAARPAAPPSTDATPLDDRGESAYSYTSDYEVDFPTDSWVEKVERFRRRAQHLRMNLLDPLARDRALARMERENATADMLFQYKQSALPPRPAARFANPQAIDTVSNGPLPAFVRTISAACGVNIVMPSHLRMPVTVSVTQTPCNVLFETVLEAHGLDYTFDPLANLIRIAPRKELVQEREDATERAALRAQLPALEPLPAGPLVSLDVKDAELRDVLAKLVERNKVNLVMPDHLHGQITIATRNVPWTAALEGVLAAQGLGYRYRPEGRILRVAPLKELDHEDEETVDNQQ